MKRVALLPGLLVTVVGCAQLSPQQTALSTPIAPSAISSLTRSKRGPNRVCIADAICTCDEWHAEAIASASARVGQSGFSQKIPRTPFAAHASIIAR